MSEVNDIIRGIQKLDIVPQIRGDVEPHPSPALVQALETSKLTIFEPIADLGYFGWDPSGSYRELSEVSVDEIKKSLAVDMKPPVVVKVHALRYQVPLFFENLPPREHINKYPYKQPHVTSLHVAAVCRGADLCKIKFYFGGSILHVLATCTIPSGKDYLVTIFPASDVIMVMSQKEYTQNTSDPGFQFERFVTGKTFADHHGSAELTHLQLMDVGGHRVLFSAEVDAMDSEGNPVEITCANPRYWGTRKMYQMLSSGSLTLYRGTKYRSRELTKVHADSLSKVMSNALSNSSSSSSSSSSNSSSNNNNNNNNNKVSQQERRIQAAMDTLLKESSAGRLEGRKIFKIGFDDSSALFLEPFEGVDVLTPEGVIKELLHS